MSLPDTDPESSDDSPSANSVGLDEWPIFEMEYAIDSKETGDQCTLYPRDVGEELCGEWISAKAGSFVSVDSVL